MTGNHCAQCGQPADMRLDAVSPEKIAELFAKANDRPEHMDSVQILRVQILRRKR